MNLRNLLIPSRLSEYPSTKNNFEYYVISTLLWDLRRSTL